MLANAYSIWDLAITSLDIPLTWDQHQGKLLTYPEIPTQGGPIFLNQIPNGFGSLTSSQIRAPLDSFPPTRPLSMDYLFPK